MKQTNVEKGNVRKLMLSLTIEEKKGYEISKKIAKRFLENKVQYKFFCSKYSAGYRFDDFYIKVFYPKYEKGKVEVVVYKNTKERQRYWSKSRAFRSKIQSMECRKTRICITNNISIRKVYR